MADLNKGIFLVLSKLSAMTGGVWWTTLELVRRAGREGMKSHSWNDGKRVPSLCMIKVKKCGG
jgi:hypothetical protein